MRRVHSRDRDAIRSLRSLSVFKGCSDEELCVARSLMTPVGVRAGTTLITEDEPGHECYIIRSGIAVVAREGVPVARLGSGEMVGEMSLIDGAPRTATVWAYTDLELFVQSEREFTSLLERSSSVARNVMRMMSRRMRAAA
jgi:CRP/FNR family transcriptional regulator, cyclic AMP receptor protein